MAKFLGVTVTRETAQPIVSESRELVVSDAKALQAPLVNPATSGRGLWGWIREPFTGAWARNMECETQENLLKFSALFATVTRIADDISKLRPLLERRQPNTDIWLETEATSPYWPVLRRPNRYQNRIQFLESWVLSKLLWGNTYVLKGSRDDRGIVTSLFVLDPRFVTPLVGTDGSVWYNLKRDDLSNITADNTVPASEIIHDRGATLYHPLLGVSPLYAAAVSCTQGIRIQHNSGKFFENMSRPSGILTAPGEISDVTAGRLKVEWDKNYGGGNLGRLAVLGNGLTYEAMTIPAVDAQLIQQLEWTVADVARPFHMPLHKIGAGAPPTFNNIASLNQDYYNQTLHKPIECIELLLDEGLGVPADLWIQLDLEGLLRMDPKTRAEVSDIGVKGKWLAPNEARKRDNLMPVVGGEEPLGQMQDFKLSKLAARPDSALAPATPPAPAPAPAPAPEDEDEAGDELKKDLRRLLFKKKMADMIQQRAATGLR